MIPSPHEEAVDFVFSKNRVTEQELTDLLVPVMERHVPNPPSNPNLRGLLGVPIGTFTDPVWRTYLRTFRPSYTRPGKFVGSPTIIARGGRDYIFRNEGPDKFRYIRANGQEIVPGTMVTDGGSIPRIAWAIPGLDPWSMMPAFLIHDWDFMAHHCIADYSRAFEEANETLAEGVYTLMLNDVVPQDWRVLVAIYAGVSSYVGWRVWGREWSKAQCNLALNPQ